MIAVLDACVLYPPALRDVLINSPYATRRPEGLCPPNTAETARTARSDNRSEETKIFATESPKIDISIYEESILPLIDGRQADK